MSRLDSVALSWALQIPCRGELSGLLLRVCARADATHVTRRTMTTLCYELQADPSTIRRQLAYLEAVGAIERLTAPGRGAQQVIRVCVETPPAQILQAMRGAGNPGTDARVSDPKLARPRLGLGHKPAQETRANNPRTVARVSPNGVVNPGTDARVSSSEIGTTRALAYAQVLDTYSGIDTKSGIETDFTQTTAPGESLREGLDKPSPPAPKARQPKASSEPVLSSAERSKLHERWDKRMDPGEVDESCQQALAHKAARNYGSGGWFLYVNGWIRRELERRPNGVSSGSPNGHIRGNNSRYKGDAQEMSELRQGIRLGADAVVE